MDAIEAIKNRRSVRQYGDRPIARDVLERIIDAARFSPTARNEQPWEFVAVTDKTTVQALAGITDHGKFMADAAACVAVFCRDTKYYLEDGSAATQSLMVAAASLGVGSCWIAGDKKGYCGRIGEALDAPAGLKLVSLVALGYPPECPVPAVQKRALTEVLHWEKF